MRTSRSVFGSVGDSELSWCAALVSVSALPGTRVTDYPTRGRRPPTTALVCVGLSSCACTPPPVVTACVFRSSATSVLKFSVKD